MNGIKMFQSRSSIIFNIMLVAIILNFFVVTTASHYSNIDNSYAIQNFIIEQYDTRYKPDWNDLDTRPLPEWYDKAKIGIFLHWGIFSVPSFGSEWFWSYWHGKKKEYVDFMNQNYPPEFTYQDFAPLFKGEFFEPHKWADLFVKSGARYIVLTSKHHEGFTLFPSKRSFSWNAVDVGPKRDLVGELSQAVREKGLKFGVYHSLYEWFNPIYEEDKNSSFTKQIYTDNKMIPDIKQIINDYKPSVLWSDGDWEADDTYWRSKDLIAWLYNDSPVKNEIVVNDRWGIGIPGKHGDFYNHADRYNPEKLMKHKWENAFTLDKSSWGYRRNMDINDVLTFDEILRQVVTTVSCGGNALINIGPTKEGTLPLIFQERLMSLGEWLEINGEAIYDSSPWIYQNDTSSKDIWFTCSKAAHNVLDPTGVPYEFDTIKAIYAIFLKWPQDNILTIHNAPVGSVTVTLLGNDQPLEIHHDNDHLNISLPPFATVKSKNAWTLKITQV